MTKILTSRQPTDAGAAPNGRTSASVVHHVHRTLVHLLIFTGTRRGEVLGLHGADLDLDRSQLTFRRQVIDAGPGPVLGAPKAAAGVGVVPIDPDSVDVLRPRRRRQVEESRARGGAWPDDDLVVAREDGSLLRPDRITSLFPALVERSGAPRIRLHDLRHTRASPALAAGVDIKVVSDRLGHSTTHITANLSTDGVPAVARSAADAIAATVASRRGADGGRC